MWTNMPSSQNVTFSHPRPTKRFIMESSIINIYFWYLREHDYSTQIERKRGTEKSVKIIKMCGVKIQV